MKAICAFFGIGAMTLLAGCADTSDPYEVNEILPPCGSYSSSFFGIQKTYPAVDEGSGKVGLLETYGSGHVIEDGQPSGHYRLYDCRTGRAAGFNDYLDLSASRDPADPAPTLEGFVANARKNGLMAQPDRLVAQAKRAGFRPATADQSGPSAEYASCACQHFYPDLVAERAAQ